jgi:hypothetical protein
MSVLARLKFNGLLYGFDYGLYQPDGANYTYKTLQLIGVDPLKASVDVSNWYSSKSLRMQGISPNDVAQDYFDYPKGRFLFPFLSVPFVKLLGLQGVLVIPIISFFVLQICVFYLGVKFNRVEIGTVIAITISVSPTVLRWMVNDCSDALFVGILSSIPLILIIKNQRAQHVLLFITSVAATLTRFSLPIFLAIGGVMLIKRKYSKALLVIVTTIIANIPALTQINSKLLPASDMNFWNKITNLPVVAFKVGFIEIAQLAVLDRILLFFLILSIYYALVNRQKDSSMYFLAILLGVWALGTVNGTLGVNFRYQLPLLIFSAWVLLDNLPRVLVVSDVHVKGKETQN